MCQVMDNQRPVFLKLWPKNVTFISNKYVAVISHKYVAVISNRRRPKNYVFSVRLVLTILKPKL